MSRLIVDINLAIPICYDKDSSCIVVHQVFQPCTSRLDVRDHLETFHVCQLEVTILRNRVDETKGSISIDTHYSFRMSFQQLSLLIPHVVEFLGNKELVNDATVEPNIQGLEVCTPVHHICLAIESAGPHSFERPRSGRLVHINAVDDESSHCGRILRTSHRFLPRQCNISEV